MVFPLILISDPKILTKGLLVIRFILFGILDRLDKHGLIVLVVIRVTIGIHLSWGLVLLIV
jgi:hypothetical protein